MKPRSIVLLSVCIALRAGRLYGAFEVLGYPVGFDYRVVVDDQTRPMGSEVALTYSNAIYVR